MVLKGLFHSNIKKKKKKSIVEKIIIIIAKIACLK